MTTTVLIYILHNSMFTLEVTYTCRKGYKGEMRKLCVPAAYRSQHLHVRKLNEKEFGLACNSTKAWLRNDSNDDLRNCWGSKLLHNYYLWWTYLLHFLKYSKVYIYPHVHSQQRPNKGKTIVYVIVIKHSKHFVWKVYNVFWNLHSSPEP